MRFTTQQYEALVARQTAKKLLKKEKKNDFPNGVPKQAQIPDPTVNVKKIVFRGDPIGKPRMSQRDKWQKRPCVLAYRKFADEMRAAAGQVAPGAQGLRVTAYISMRNMWNEKKRLSLDGQPHRTKPDCDNILKAVADALFDNDATIWVATIIKFWCQEGNQRLEIEIEY